MNPRVGIIGAGLIGAKRARALGSTARLLAVADQQKDRAKDLASRYSADVEDSGSALIARDDLDIVIVCAYHSALADLGIRALASGKHVLVEKPGGTRPEEMRALEAAASKAGKTAAIGFNHRFHPALSAARERVHSGNYGPVLYLRGRYGHGGRPGYEKEWRANPALSGGGELLDQGIHLIDLCQWIAGPFELKHGHVQNFFWSMPVEDNAFLLLRSPDQKRIAQIHASWTEWKNCFELEIFCERAKLQVTGLGGSYGTEQLKVYTMKPELGPPDLEETQFPGEDRSWELEWAAFLARIAGKPSELAKPAETAQALAIVQSCYGRSS